MEELLLLKLLQGILGRGIAPPLAALPLVSENSGRVTAGDFSSWIAGKVGSLSKQK